MIWMIVLGALFAAGYAVYRYTAHESLSLEKKHVLITGGSKGIGKAMAVEALRMGANVTIFARDKEVLEEAKLDLLKKAPCPGKQKVVAISVDISTDFYSLEKSVSDAESILGPVYLLINCAGTAVAHRFDETPVDEFKRMMEVNYLGTVYTTRAVLPSMKAQKEGVIVLFSSIAGLFGLYGYSAYAPSKFAVVGLAEVLAMELEPFNIKVSVSFPPDTDTPGFAIENQSKPSETKMISESGGTFDPETVARKALKDALAGKFASTVGFEGLMVATVCSGMMPVKSCLELFWQIISMGLFRLVSVFFLSSCRKIVRKCLDERERNKKE
jgi:3-dehydrosphinganine reductase